MYLSYTQQLILVLVVLALGNCKQLNFWQITDTHTDWLYQENITPYQGACRSNTSGDSGHFGDYQCDVPLITQASAIEQMKAIEPNPQFIIYSGDSFPHASGTSSDVFNSVSNTTIELKKNFPQTPIIYAIGNHDTYPCHCVLPNSDTLSKLGDIVKDYLTPDQLVTFKQGGYYATSLSGYKIIVVNTVFYYSLNSYTENMTDDIGGQLAFIKQQLDDAQNKSQQVLIVGHLSPGFSEVDFSANFHNELMNSNYTKVFEGYKGIIKGHFYGHLHFDSFRLTKDNGVMFLAPALTPWFNYDNPDTSIPNEFGMARLFTFESDSGSLISYKQYWANLTLSNIQMKITWELEYDTSSTPYYLSDLSLDSYTALANRLESEDNLFAYFRASTLVQHQQPPCNKQCQRRYLCVVRNIYLADLQLCQQVNEIKIEEEIKQFNINQVQYKFSKEFLEKINH